MNIDFNKFKNFPNYVEQLKGKSITCLVKGWDDKNLIEDNIMPFSIRIKDAVKAPYWDDHVLWLFLCEILTDGIRVKERNQSGLFNKYASPYFKELDDKTFVLFKEDNSFRGDDLNPDKDGLSLNCKCVLEFDDKNHYCADVAHCKAYEIDTIDLFYEEKDAFKRHEIFIKTFKKKYNESINSIAEDKAKEFAKLSQKLDKEYAGIIANLKKRLDLWEHLK